jgi:GNAT superfamily N-acetyltransferase
VPWRLTGDVETYAQHARGLLAADPVENTVALTVLEVVRGGHRWSDERMRFGWFEDDGGVRGAVSHTPPFELLLGVVPADTTDALVAALRADGADPPGVSGDIDTVARFVDAWTAGSHVEATLGLELRLYALATLVPPDPPVPGRGRPATLDDLATCAAWISAFQVEAGMPAADAEASARERIGDARLWLWEDGGSPVAFAARTLTTAGVARVGPVYTPPEQRRRGYGAAVTAACTGDGLARGARRMVLFTDLANPTSNSIYQRIGYRPVSDRRLMRFTPRQ